MADPAHSGDWQRRQVRRFRRLGCYVDQVRHLRLWNEHFWPGILIEAGISTVGDDADDLAIWLGVELFHSTARNRQVLGQRIAGLPIVLGHRLVEEGVVAVEEFEDRPVLAEDVGEYGKIQMTDAVAKKAGVRRERPTLEFTVSGLDLRAYDV